MQAITKKALKYGIELGSLWEPDGALYLAMRQEKPEQPTWNAKTAGRGLSYLQQQIDSGNHNRDDDDGAAPDKGQDGLPRSQRDDSHTDDDDGGGGGTPTDEELEELFRSQGGNQSSPNPSGNDSEPSSPAKKRLKSTSTGQLNSQIPGYRHKKAYRGKAADTHDIFQYSPGREGNHGSAFPSGRPMDDLSLGESHVHQDYQGGTSENLGGHKGRFGGRESRSTGHPHSLSPFGEMGKKELASPGRQDVLDQQVIPIPSDHSGELELEGELELGTRETRDSTSSSKQQSLSDLETLLQNKSCLIKKNWLVGTVIRTLLQQLCQGTTTRVIESLALKTQRTERARNRILPPKFINTLHGPTPWNLLLPVCDDSHWVLFRVTWYQVPLQLGTGDEQARAETRAITCPETLAEVSSIQQWQWQWKLEGYDSRSQGGSEVAENNKLEVIGFFAWLLAPSFSHDAKARTGNIKFELKECPQQTNTDDCGVYVVAIGSQLAKDFASPKQVNPALLRQHYANMLLTSPASVLPLHVYESSLLESPAEFSNAGQDQHASARAIRVHPKHKRKRESRSEDEPGNYITNSTCVLRYFHFKCLIPLGAGPIHGINLKEMAKSEEATIHVVSMQKLHSAHEKALRCALDGARRVNELMELHKLLVHVQKMKGERLGDSGRKQGPRSDALSYALASFQASGESLLYQMDRPEDGLEALRVETHEAWALVVALLLIMRRAHLAWPLNSRQ